MNLPNKKIIKRASGTMLVFMSLMMTVTAYQGTLTFEGEIVELSLFYSILLGLLFFLAIYALFSFIIFLVYTVFGEIEQTN